MSTFSELVMAQFLKFVQEKNGGVPGTQHEMEALFKEFQEQFNAKAFHDDLAEALPLTRETAKTVYDWLELAEQQKTKKAKRECLEKAKELDPCDVDVLMQLLLLEKKQKWEYIPEVKKILALGKEDLKRQKLYKESMGNFYMVIETRPYMRAMQYYMELLESCCMIQQAIAVAREMLKLNRNDNQGIRFYLMALYVYSEDEFNARKLIQENKEEENRCFFAMSMALLKFRQGKWDEAKVILERLKIRYKGFRDFLRDAAAGRNVFYTEANMNYYQPFTRSELVTMVLDFHFLWDGAQEFFNWAKTVMSPTRKRKGKKEEGRVKSAE